MFPCRSMDNLVEAVTVLLTCKAGCHTHARQQSPSASTANGASTLQQIACCNCCAVTPEAWSLQQHNVLWVTHTLTLLAVMKAA